MGDKCPVCNKELEKIEESNKPSDFWNIKNVKITKKCGRHFLYKYIERKREVHEES